jgi:hypothetical protein
MRTQARDLPVGPDRVQFDSGAIVGLAVDAPVCPPAGEARPLVDVRRGGPWLLQKHHNHLAIVIDGHLHISANFGAAGPGPRGSASPTRAETRPWLPPPPYRPWRRRSSWKSSAISSCACLGAFRCMLQSLWTAQRCTAALGQTSCTALRSPATQSMGAESLRETRSSRNPTGTPARPNSGAREGGADPLLVGAWPQLRLAPRRDGRSVKNP